MNRFTMLVICTLTLVLFTACTPAPTVTPVPPTPVPPTPTPQVPTFAKDKGLEVSNSEVTGKGEVSFEVGASADTLKITVSGTVPVTNQNAICWLCLDTIHIAPGLKIAVEFIGTGVDMAKTIKVYSGTLKQNLKVVEVNGLRTIKNPPEIESITYEAVVLEYPLMTTSINAIVAGSQGATLKKDGKLLFLLKGDAYLQR